MSKSIRFALTGVALAVGLVSGAMAQGRTASGSHGGIGWEATSMLTGTTNTQVPPAGGLANGGDPIYWPVYPRDSGVVALIMDYGPTIGSFICSGTLLADRQSILTAAHCVSDGAGTANPLTTTVHFQPAGGLAAGTRIHTPLAPGVETRTVTNYFVNGAYTGQVIDHNDVAVLRLNAPAPMQAASYGLYTTQDLEGQNFMVQGYGRLGSGATGANNFTARLRNGDNKYDYELGNAIFGNNWGTVLGAPMDRIRYSIVSDFDNGLAANDVGCLGATAPNIGGAAGAVFCDLGVGAREVGVAGGDSGGPNFINGMISGINSYGLKLTIGDFDATLNSSFGEYSGYVPTWLHAQWIQSVMVPEPGTYALMGLGLAAVAGFARRRRQQA